MSCSSYCQGLQSCLEPARLVEPCVLRLKLAPSKTNISSRSSLLRKSFIADTDRDAIISSENVDMGGWSFLQSLEKESIDKDKVYVPPSFKRSASSVLNEKSLEMCTESLGSETGSDGGESSDEMALLSLENENHETRQKSKLRESRRSMSRSSSFPPPLTSISGSSTVQMRPHREGGRLVLKAVTVSSSQACFLAERINGRLRLHLMKDFNSISDKTEEEEGEEEQETLNERLVEEEEEEEEEEMEKLDRPSRCKEGESGSKSLMNWEPFWVAT